MYLQKKLTEMNNKSADEVASYALQHANVLTKLFELPVTRDKHAKTAAGKVFQILSEKQPVFLYGYFENFMDLFKSGDAILKLTAINVIGNLASVDTLGKINDQVLEKLLACLADVSMITAGHAIDSLGKIALNKDQFRDGITRHLLKLEGSYRDPECCNILMGFVLLAFMEYYPKAGPREQDKMVSFAERQLKSTRLATVKKAERFLKKYSL